MNSDRVDFRDVAPGDVLDFNTWTKPGLRRGTVTAVTAVTVTVACGTDGTALLRRRDWRSRNVRRTATAAPLPYGPDAAVYVERPGRIHVFWTADPHKAVRLARDEEDDVNTIAFARDSDDVEMVAVAQRFTQAQGAVFTGWIIRSGIDDSCPIDTKAQMLEELGRTVTRYWDRGQR